MTKERVPLWVLIAAVFAAFLFGASVGISYHSSEAIRVGAAEWICNPKTGVSSFHWKDKP